MSVLHLLRRLFVGNKNALVEEAMLEHFSQVEPSAEVRLLEKLGPPSRSGGSVLVGYGLETGEPIEMSIKHLAGVHRWSTGSTGSGKSAQVFGEEIQLIGPGVPWSLLHLDAKSESAKWITDLLVPALCSQWSEEEGRRFFESYRVINPFDVENMPALNVLRPVEGVPIGLQAREVATLIGESLGSQFGAWGPRMTNVLHYSLRLALELRELSLLEVRSFLTRSEYLLGLLRFVDDPDIREYFVHRFPTESKEAIRAVVSRLDLLLMEDTARVLCAPGCLDFSEILESRLSVIDVGRSPQGGEFLTNFWLGVFVRGISRAILSRPEGRPPAFCVIDEWWMALDKELSTHFERLLSLARFKNVGLWLVNQLPGQVSAKSPVLLATIKNACGIQTAFRQSHEDARAFGYMLPTGEHVRVKRDLDGADWDTRRARPEELRRMHVEELSRLPARQFWLYPRALGLEAVKVVAPDVPFDVLRKVADLQPAWIRELCRGVGQGHSRAELDEAIQRRRAHINAVESGVAESPGPNWSGPVPEVRVFPEPVRPNRRDEDTRRLEPTIKAEPTKRRKQRKPKKAEEPFLG